jgi:hypothetical protein
MSRILTPWIVGSVAWSHVAAAGFDASQVTTWVGRGTNQAVMVIDWNDGIAPASTAWGYRWDGSATSRDVLEAVAASDAGLHFCYHPGFPGTIVFGIGYDGDGDRGRFVRGVPGLGQESGFAIDPDDHYREGWFDGFWSIWIGNGNPYADGAWEESSLGFSFLALTNGSWLGWGFDADFSSIPGGTDDAPGLPVAARSDYAVEVMDYVEGTGVGLDAVSGDPFNDPDSALGRPTIDTTGDGVALPETNPVPTVPVGPAFRWFELVSIGNGGRLVLRFDHPVLDDPANPYGMDFIVYGNAFFNLAGGGTWENGNPSNAAASALLESEPALVSVSQDGTNFLSMVSGPFADDFAPTLGRRYDPAHAVSIPGMTNLWWAGETDPTLPLDPAIGPADLAGHPLAEIAGFYGRAAGGTAYDISALSLAADPATGWKWIQYLKIERQGFFNPEIDAVADVAPGTPYDHWWFQHFTFTERADASVSAGGADPDGDRRANLFECVGGLDPHVAEPGSVYGAAQTGITNAPAILISYSAPAGLRDIAVQVERSEDGSSWSTGGIDQAHSVSPGTGQTVLVEARVPADSTTHKIRLRALHPLNHESFQ